jgi:hypothetical protein
MQVVLPATVPASLAYLHAGGCYLLDNGQLLVLWVGREAAQDWLVQVGVARAMRTMRKWGKDEQKKEICAQAGRQTVCKHMGSLSQNRAVVDNDLCCVLGQR